MANVIPNVVFITDVNQVYYAITNTLMIERQSNKEIYTHIVITNIDSKMKILIEKLVIDLQIKFLTLHFICTDNMYLGESKIEHITNITNVRLYLSTLFPEINNILYLDNDIVVIGDVSDVFEKLDPSYSYGRPWSLEEWWVKSLKFKRMLKNNWYVNAGVLYLNLENIRKKNLEKKFVSFLKRKKRKIKYADQDVLNCNLKFEPLPHTWNIARDRWKKNKEDIAKESSLRIYHFLSKQKQWGEMVNEINVSDDKGALTNSELKALEEPQKIWKKYFKEVEEKIKEIN